MRVLLDSNIYITYLLSEGNVDSPVSQVIHSALEGKFDLIVAEEIIDELWERIANKPYLRQRIDQSSFQRFESLLRTSGEILSPLQGASPQVTRDRKDDFLLAASAIGDVDVLVSGDHDLHAVKHLLTRPKIMNPAEFLEFLEWSSMGRNGFS